MTVKETNAEIFKLLRHLSEQVDDLREQVVDDPDYEPSTEGSEAGDSEAGDEPVEPVRTRPRDPLNNPIPSTRLLVQILQMMHSELEFAEAVGTFMNRRTGDMFVANQSTVLKRVLEWRVIHEAREVVGGAADDPVIELSFRDCVSDPLGADAIKRATGIMWDERRLPETLQDQYAFGFSRNAKEFVLRARMQLSEVLYQPRIKGWPLSGFLINENTRNTFARFTATVAQESSTLVPSSDQFNRTYDRVQQAVFSDCLFFCGCTFDGEQVLLRNETSSRNLEDSTALFRRFPTERTARFIRPSY